MRRQSVTLDLSHVERIDAAGVAALISLYGIARNSGKQFHVTRAHHRVAEILAIVGLDRILLTQDAAAALHPDTCLAQSAA